MSYTIQARDKYKEAVPIKANPDGSLVMGSEDLFGIFPVGLPYTEADNTMIYDDHEEERFDYLLSGSGEGFYYSGASKVQLAVGTESGAKATFTSRLWYRYQAGKTQKIVMTLNPNDDEEPNRVRRWGYFDEYNGLFFMLSGTEAYVIERSNVSGEIVDLATEIPKSITIANNSHITGTKTQTWDFSKNQISDIRFQWLGVGSIFYHLQGDSFYSYQVHESHHANQTTEVYMRTPNLPVRYEIENLDTCTASGTLYPICSSVQSIGGSDLAVFKHGAESGLKTISSTEILLLCVRLKSTYKGEINRGIMFPKTLEMTSEGNTTFRMYHVHTNPITAGAVWTDVDGDHSGMEFTISGTIDVSGESPFMSKSFLGAGGEHHEIKSGLTELFLTRSASNSDANSDYLLITGQKIKGSDTDGYVSLELNEVH